MMSSQLVTSMAWGGALPSFAWARSALSLSSFTFLYCLVSSFRRSFLFFLTLIASRLPDLPPAAYFDSSLALPPFFFLSLRSRSCRSSTWRNMACVITWFIFCSKLNAWFGATLVLMLRLDVAALTVRPNSLLLSWQSATRPSWRSLRLESLFLLRSSNNRFIWTLTVPQALVPL